MQQQAPAAWAASHAWQRRRRRRPRQRVGGSPHGRWRAESVPLSTVFDFSSGLHSDGWVAAPTYRPGRSATVCGASTSLGVWSIRPLSSKRSKLVYQAGLTPILAPSTQSQHRPLWRVCDCAGSTAAGESRTCACTACSVQDPCHGAQRAAHGAAACPATRGRRPAPAAMDAFFDDFKKAPTEEEVRARQVQQGSGAASRAGARGAVTGALGAGVPAAGPAHAPPPLPNRRRQALFNDEDFQRLRALFLEPGLRCGRGGHLPLGQRQRRGTTRAPPPAAPGRAGAPLLAPAPACPPFDPLVLRHPPPQMGPRPQRRRAARAVQAAAARNPRQQGPLPGGVQRARDTCWGPSTRRSRGCCSARTRGALRRNPTRASPAPTLSAPPTPGAARLPPTGCHSGRSSTTEASRTSRPTRTPPNWSCCAQRSPPRRRAARGWRRRRSGCRRRRMRSPRQRRTMSDAAQCALRVALCV